MNNSQIIKIEATNKHLTEIISKLHSRLLPESSLSRLGQFFLKNYYYKVLVKNGLIDAYLYKTRNCYVGFVVCTDFPFNFMKKGMQRNLLYLFLIIFISLCQNPFRVKILIDILGDKFPALLKNKIGVESGQFLSFGVLEEYRVVVDNESGQTIPHTLMKKVFEHFKERKKKYFFLLVLKSNINAIKFYKKYKGTTMDDCLGNSHIMKFEA